MPDNAASTNAGLMEREDTLRQAQVISPGHLPEKGNHPQPQRRKPNGRGRDVHPTKADSLPKEIDFAELEDGSLVELIENPGDPTRTALAVWREGEVFYTDRLQVGRQELVPVQREGMMLKHLRLPRGAKPYESVEKLLPQVKDLISCCVILEDPNHLFALGRFVLSTWLVDRFPVALYVALVGLPQSGKTTLLKALSLVCRCALLTADITSAAFYDACSRFTPTLLIDETSTHGDNRYLRHMLRVGTTRDVVAMRKNQSFHAYGAKVICFLEPPDDPALNSRCLWIPTKEANKPGLLKPTDPKIEQLAMDLQQQLLQFRFEHYRSVELPEICGAEALRPRTRDLFRCLAAVYPEDSYKQEYLLDFFKFHDATTREPLSPPQNAILRELFAAAHYHTESKSFTVGRLTEVVNDFLEKAGERFRLEPRKVGSVLTSLGFQRRVRTNQGWVLYLDESDLRQIHQLAKAYGIDNLPSKWLRVPLEECRLCQESGIVRQSGKKASCDKP